MWLSPFSRCSSAIFWRNCGDIMVNLSNQQETNNKSITRPSHTTYKSFLNNSCMLMGWTRSGSYFQRVKFPNINATARVGEGVGQLCRWPGNLNQAPALRSVFPITVVKMHATSLAAWPGPAAPRPASPPAADAAQASELPSCFLKARFCTRPCNK